MKDAFVSLDEFKRLRLVVGTVVSVETIQGVAIVAVGEERALVSAEAARGLSPGTRVVVARGLATLRVQGAGTFTACLVTVGDDRAVAVASPIPEGASLR